MDYAALSPHVGSWAIREDIYGNSSIRGGAINWGNIGSRISSALGTTGRWLGNVGNRFVNSNTFNQIKQGIRDSGVIKNAANLAGETVNGLIDIGKLKLQHDLENLRRKAIGENTQHSVEELKSLIASLQAQLGSSEPHKNTSTTHNLRPTTRPIPEMAMEIGNSGVEPQINSSSPSVPSTLDIPPPAKRPRKKPRYGSWRQRLNTMTGSGVNVSSRRMCY